MQKTVKLRALRPFLPPPALKAVEKIVDRPEDAEVIRKARGNLDSGLPSAVDDEATYDEKGKRKRSVRSATRYVSTKDVDHSGDIMLPGGADLSVFRLNPIVLHNHNHLGLPVGSDNDPGFIEADDNGLKARTIYADTEEIVKNYWPLVRDRHINASSVGFHVLSDLRPGDKRFDEITGKLSDELESDEVRKAERVVDRWLLLEHSDVNIPDNPHALNLEVEGKMYGKAALRYLGAGGPEPESEEEKEEKERLRVERDPLRICAPRRKLIVLDPAKPLAKRIEGAARDAVRRRLGMI